MSLSNFKFLDVVLFSPKVASKISLVCFAWIIIVKKAKSIKEKVNMENKEPLFLCIAGYLLELAFLTLPHPNNIEIGVYLMYHIPPKEMLLISGASIVVSTILSTA